MRIKWTVGAKFYGAETLYFDANVNGAEMEGQIRLSSEMGPDF